MLDRFYSLYKAEFWNEHGAIRISQVTPDFLCPNMMSISSGQASHEAIAVNNRPLIHGRLPP